jgi:hypothetical protein
MTSQVDFKSHSRIFSLIWRRHHCRWRAAKFRPMLGAQGLWAGRDIYRATPAVTRDLGFSGLIRWTTPNQSPLTTHMGMWRIYSNQDPQREITVMKMKIETKLHMWPVSRGCFLLLGTWSYLHICRRSVLPSTRFCNCLLDYDCVLHIVNFAILIGLIFQLQLHMVYIYRSLFDMQKLVWHTIRVYNSFITIRDYILWHMWCKSDVDP